MSITSTLWAVQPVLVSPLKLFPQETKCQTINLIFKQLNFKDFIVLIFLILIFNESKLTHHKNGKF